MTRAALHRDTTPGLTALYGGRSISANYPLEATGSGNVALADRVRHAKGAHQTGAILATRAARETAKFAHGGANDETQ